MFHTLYHSPVGPLTLSSDGTALTGLAFSSTREPMASLPLFQAAFAWLDAYFAGRDPGPRRLFLRRGPPFSSRCGGN